MEAPEPATCAPLIKAMVTPVGHKHLHITFGTPVTLILRVNGIRKNGAVIYTKPVCI